MEQRGGKMVGTGSQTCIFKPMIPCSDGTKYDNYISKVFVSKKIKINDEKEKTKLITSLPDVDKWAVVLEKTCTPPNYNDVYRFDKDILSCINKFDLSKDHFDNYKQMMYGPYGGISMNDTFLNITKNNDYLNPNKEFIPQIHPYLYTLFLGIYTINKYNILHFDIKPGNILYNPSEKNGSLRYIDFGITCRFSDKFIFDRSKIEFDTTRLYIFYPYEFIYMNINYGDLKDEIVHYKSRSNYDLYEFIHKNIFHRNIDSHIKHIIKEHKSQNKKEIIRKLDIYSLGITIMKTIMGTILSKKLTTNHIVAFFKHKHTKPLTNLLRKMTEPDYKHRINAEECYQMFNKLI